jgi:transketolase
MNLIDLKKKILQISNKSKEGHVASSFSILDILWVLYNEILHLDDFNTRDRFILSKGHASLGLYSILNYKKYITGEEFDSFCKFDSILGGHPNKNKIKWVEASTGSLGHGLPVSVGMAMGLKISCSTSKVYCLIGDGELNEGSNWESVMLASNHNLSNLHCIIDYNHSGDRAVNLNDISCKFKSFDWEVISIDGHNHNDIKNSLNMIHNKPLAIIANTIKGKGCKIMENNPEWHHKSPTDEELEILLKDLI